MTKISALPTDSAPTSDDYIPAVDSTSSTTKKVPLSALTPMYNPYKFSVYSSTSPSLTANVALKVPLNTELFDTSSNFASEKFTAPISGFYQFSAQVAISSSGISTGYAQAWLYVNGAIRITGNRQVGSGSATTIPKIRLDCMLELTAGDYVELYGLCSEATRTIVGGQSETYLMGFLVSRT